MTRKLLFNHFHVSLAHADVDVLKQQQNVIVNWICVLDVLRTGNSGDNIVLKNGVGAGTDRPDLD